MDQWPPLPTLSFLRLLFGLLVLSSSCSSYDLQGTYQPYMDCSTAPTIFTCGSFVVNISYPFTLAGRTPDNCGHPGYALSCMESSSTLTISISDVQYVVKSINFTSSLLSIVDMSYVNQACPMPSKNTTIDSSLFYFSATYQQIILFMECDISPLTYGALDCLYNQTSSRVFYSIQDSTSPPQYQSCRFTTTVGMSKKAMMKMTIGEMTFGEALQEGYTVGWTAGEGWCSNCTDWGGVCGYDSSRGDACLCPYGLSNGNGCPPQGGKSRTKNKIAIGAGAAAAVVGSIAASFLFFFLFRRRQNQQFRRTRPPPPIVLGRSSMSDPEPNIALFRAHIFSYRELEEATNGFDASAELGDGGFGTVYKGKFRDGRLVAVKRFHEGHSKQAEQQFMKEVSLLSQLRHQNLVTVYGCSTSVNSRSLLLVSEYVSNGTLADHLHGSRAEGTVLLTWPIRMRVAVEVADGLSYLHNVEPQIIHREFKSTNVLLDNNLHVKLCDFGLSRLLPADVSKAPIGTPGYVDPEQQQLKLTDKSDVYSFGVVLLELISSKRAFDVSRAKDEMVLAEMAIKRMRNKELHQFVDQRMEYSSDSSPIKRMIDAVAELALSCLQPNKDQRPSMMELLGVLRGIQSGNFDPNNSNAKLW